MNEDMGIPGELCMSDSVLLHHFLVAAHGAC